MYILKIKTFLTVIMQMQNHMYQSMCIVNMNGLVMFSLSRSLKLHATTYVSANNIYWGGSQYS